ncbi:hypothetical protein NQ317_001595 [Molorchus minor]|uniref:Arrestin C-terminal-like domain-containing protein n=1 Tax=Molorchus minor TaxID=1323400 RepID=A0ABQ9IWG3_9CUCU|nr:hypothetical protein NQ317_001595 [Molorchus minor]
MDYIREFDIQLEKEYYYAGGNGRWKRHFGNCRELQVEKVILRGKAHAEWKVLLSGDRRTVKDDQCFVDERQIIWGEKNLETTIPILPRGAHKFPFRFCLPESILPCSFESKQCYIRYFFQSNHRYTVCKPPQGIKYFTVIGPHIDCMEEQYLKPIVLENRKSTCCWCCKKGTIYLRCVVARSAYVCKESIKLKVTIDNQGDEEVKLRVKLEQCCEFFIDRGVLGVSKDLKHLVFEYGGCHVKPHTRSKWDSSNCLVIPPMPTTLVHICRLVQIYYLLTVYLDTDKEYDILQIMHVLSLKVGCTWLRSFFLGQVYDGNEHHLREPVILYKPMYVTVDKSEDNK